MMLWFDALFRPSVPLCQGCSAFVAFMAGLTNKKFTATQYALLTSIMGLPRVLASAPTGFAAKHLGWEGFFIGCTLAAIPGMMLLPRFAPWRPLASAKVDGAARP